MTQPRQPIHTRPATLDDLDFLVHCNQQMALETEQLELQSERLQAGIRAVLTDRTRGVYRIAERDDQRAGCLMITYEWSDWRNAWWWWIQSVYVVPPQRRHGVFSARIGTSCKRRNSDPTSADFASTSNATTNTRKRLTPDSACTKVTIGCSSRRWSEDKAVNDLLDPQRSMTPCGLQYIRFVMQRDDAHWNGMRGQHRFHCRKRRCNA